MSLKDFDIDRIDAPETPEHRTMRAMLRLSNDWKVIGRTVEHLPSEYPDEHPEVREVVDSDDLSGIGKSLGVSRIYISAVRKKRNLCPCCGQPMESRFSGGRPSECTPSRPASPRSRPWRP